MPYLYTRIKRAEWQQKFVLGMYPPPKGKCDTTHDVYKYKFIGPACQVDPVLDAIKTAIRELETENMRIATLAIKVRNLTLSPPIWPRYKKNADIDVKMYAFRKAPEEFPRAVPVSVANRNDKGILSPNRILVRIEGKWLPVKEWLTTWAAYKHPGVTDLEAQQKWWKKREQVGKFFPFWKLPEELRIQVLLHALGTEIRPHIKWLQHSRSRRRPVVVLGSTKPDDGWMVEYHYDDSRKRNERVPHPNYAVFRVSKQLRDEALEAGWIGTPKFFSSCHDLIEVIRYSNPPTSWNWLSKIHLDFSISDYFRFFGVLDKPTIFINPEHSRGELLRGIDTLVELTLDFPAPYNKKGDDPWGIPWRAKSRWDGRRWISGSYACWKTLIDWIITFAFPFIKHIPNVHLRGCIKKVTKCKWAHILSTEYAERKLPPDAKRSHGFDYNRALTSILNVPEQDLPPACACPLSCFPDVMESWGRARQFDHNDEYKLTSKFDAGSNAGVAELEEGW